MKLNVTALRNQGCFYINRKNTMAAQGFNKPEQFREELDKSIPKE
ncbi:hypothetical protein ABN063_05530 [Providencia vermicola]